jgi:hypothetical protein
VGKLERPTSSRAVRLASRRRRRRVLASVVLGGCLLAVGLLQTPHDRVRRHGDERDARAVYSGRPHGPTIYAAVRGATAPSGISAAAAVAQGTRHAANDAADSPAQGPATAHDAALTSLIWAWLRAYLRWSLNTSAPGPRTLLRADSTARLYQQIQASPPIPTPAQRPPRVAVRSVATFRGPDGYSAIAELTARGISQAVALDITRTARGLRVSRLDV